MADLFPQRDQWRDIDRVKGTPHMNWGDCPCSQCCIWRIVARLEAAQARLAAVEAAVWALDNAIDYGAPEDPETGERWVVLGSFSTELDELITAARGEGDRPAEPGEPKRRCGPFEEREGCRHCLKCGDIIFDFEDDDSGEGDHG